MGKTLEQELHEQLEARKVEVPKTIDLPETSQETQVVAESVVNEVVSADPTSSLSDIEQKAFTMGWRPKGDYQGEHFVEAAEYVNRAPLFERIEKQTKEIRELRDLAKSTALHMSNVRKEAYETARRELEARKVQAVQVGDVDNFKKVELQEQELDKKMRADPAIMTQEIDPAQAQAVQEFNERNKAWFNDNTAENQEMKEAAMFIDQKLAKAAHEKGTKLSPQEHLKLVEDKVRKLYRDRFENTKADKPATISVSTASKSVGTSVSHLVNRLTPRQLEFGKYFQLQNPAYSLEKYAADLERQGNLGN